MPELDKVKEQFVKNGYSELPNYKLPTKLLWTPDLVFTKNHNIYLILFKSNNSIPQSFLNRIFYIPNETLIPLILFAQRLKSIEEKTILSLGISLGYFIRGRLVGFKIKEKRSQKAIRKEIKKLKVIDIFVSSKQDDVPEREFIRERIDFLRNSNSYPFNPAHLIEYDKFSIKDIYKRIDTVMTNCDWIVIILEDKFSKIVRYEIKKAISTIKHDNIFMFVKSTNECHTSWENELNTVKSMKSIKYIPYSNLPELEIVFTRAVHKRMSEICKRKKVEIFI